MNKGFVSAITPPAHFSGAAYWFIFKGSRLLVYMDDGQARLPFLPDPAELALMPLRQQYLGYCTDPDNGFHAFCAEVDAETAVPQGMAFHRLRRLFSLLDEQLVWLAGRAVQIVDWDRATQFCGQCGGRTENQTHERAKKCPQCGRTIYPRISPAVIMAVEKSEPDGNKLLLARSHRHPPGLYSVLAGFVEPGETLETAVAREVREETSVEIKNIRYFGSQPWPFPDSLMVAFTAEYAGGEIVLEEAEMEDAGWYTPDNLPQIPPSISIASRLINWFVQKNSGADGAKA
ncbi:MAG: NAD(+) diphosphatase [Ardenticatenaceae bacterium]|nr:NAD(+) diphosphatase [Anaerolineales bacterium]MCB8922041.1 NAD(+) diphosphatase [Ardenticatenaceae bacterium]MCB8989617.1 NAD(+) diphosphatase [Ardenticatenaceae bacterium]